MSELIDKFKKEHSEIVDALTDVHKLGILTDEGQAKLMSAKASVLEHLKSEDEQLYPVLREKAEHNEELKKRLDEFADDIEHVYNDLMKFFDKYSDGVIDSKVEEEYERLATSLHDRIKDEEECLYKEYDKE